MTDRIWYLEHTRKEIKHPIFNYKVKGYYTVEKTITTNNKNLLQPQNELSNTPSLVDCLNKKLGTIADVRVAKTSSDNLIIELGKSLSRAEFAKVKNGPINGERSNPTGDVIDETGVRIHGGIKRKDLEKSIDPNKMFSVKATRRKIKIKCKEDSHADNDDERNEHTVFKYDLFLCDKKSKIPLINGWIDPVIRNDGGVLN